MGASGGTQAYLSQASLSATYLPLAGGHLASDLYLDNGSGGLKLTNGPTTAQCRALQVLPVDNTKGTGLVLQGGRGMSTAGIQSQILMYGTIDAGGSNYDRLAISNVSSQVVIDSTFGGTGAARPILFQMSGSAATSTSTTIDPASNGVTLPTGTITVASTAGFPATNGVLNIVDSNGAETVYYTGLTGTTFTGCTGGTGTLATGGAVYKQVRGQTALRINADASVDINGGAATIDGIAFGATRARIADPMETGATQLIIDTRTQTGTNNAADSSSVSFARGGSTKWHVGLNYAGGGLDSFDWYNGATRLMLKATGELQVSGDAPSNYGGVLQLVNTGASGHTWRIGEFNGAAVLAFRDTTSGNFPLQLGSAGGVGVWGHAPPASQPAAITAPTAPSAGYVQAEAAAMKTAVDAIRAALTGMGVTA